MVGKQITNIEVKKNNRNRIFRYICECDKASNPDISYKLKMSLPTVTQNTKDLIEKGLIREIGELESTGGRRAKALSVVSDVRMSVGLDITRNHVSFVLVNLIGEVLHYERIFLPYHNGEEYYREVNQRLEKFLNDSAVNQDRILGIGISFPGIVNLQKEEITFSHVLSVKEIAFSYVDDFFSFPCYFFNDANAGAYAEGLRSEKPGRFFYLSLSNTVGGAIFSGGGLEQGDAFRCGEVGHMTIIPDGLPCYCGKSGCMDAYCSARKLSESVNLKLEEFFVQLKEGNKEIAAIWDEYTAYLAIAVNNIHMVLDCDIVLGGYVGSCVGEHIRDIQDKVLERGIFGEAGSYVRSPRYKIGAAAAGAALKVIETFIEQV